MTHPIFVLDTFTSERFKGSPTAVILMKKFEDTDLLQNWATELAYPVTAFVQNSGPSPYPVRYFTITEEIPACGHATLAAASVLLRENQMKELCFQTIEGIELTAQLEGALIFMRYPRFSPVDYQVRQEILQALGMESVVNSFFCAELDTAFLELSDPQELRALRPDFQALRESSEELKEVVITSRTDQSDLDFLLRSFCPWIGIDEDPVTGSVHSILGPYWAAKLGRKSLRALQASAREGEVFLRVLEDAVELGGSTVDVLQGQLKL